MKLSVIQDSLDFKNLREQWTALLDESPVESIYLTREWPLSGGRCSAIGYTFAVTYEHGVNNFMSPEIDYTALRRLDMDKESLSRIRAKCAFPGLFTR